MQKVDRINRARKYTLKEDSYIVLDLETTGLSCAVHEIIEIAAICIVHDAVEAELSMLVQCQTSLPENISKLTGITDEMLQQQGVPLYQALSQLISFAENRRIVCHNAAFDFGFLHAACQRVGLSMFHNPCIDTLTLAGFPIISFVGIDGGYEIDEQYKMHIQLADDQDYEIILSALKGFNSAFENKKIEKALNKVNLLSHASQEHIILDFSVLKEKEIINKNLLLLEKLILNQSVVEFDYTNSKNEFSQKKVDPIAIIYKWYSWYLGTTSRKSTS